MGFGSTLKKHKYLVGVSIACTAFAIATIVLAVEVARLNGELGDVVETTTTEGPVTTTTIDPSTQEPWEREYRLPADTIPVSYDLTLHPDLEAGTFTGAVTIQIQTSDVARDYVLVHHKFLEITSTVIAHVHSGERHEVVVADTIDFTPNEFWVVKTSEPLEVDSVYDLTLQFKGLLTDKIVGFYKSTYITEDDTERTIATSKFEPTYARQAFPCFDEPHMKAQFTIRLVRPTDTYNALSNMRISESQLDLPSTGLTTEVFETTVKMSTYLACFIVSDFTALPSVEINNPDGSEVATFPFSVYGTPAQTTAQKTKFALDTGVIVVQYYIQYFGIAYPLTKLDMIAIPDFVSGAMEHWGLITFREVNLLESAEISSTANRQRVATVIAHELAHMWFGNLVTMLWWDDLWLNEGFASYMEYKGTSHAYADWNMMDQFLIDDLHPVLKLDAALSSHPIIQAVGHPDQITEIFDTISYNKGAAVIRMLEDFLTEVTFEKGIQKYLTDFKFSNAQTKDLWQALQSQTTQSIDVTDIMNTWTLQMGFPVITVTKEGAGYRFRQTRFLADPDANTTGLDSEYGYKWEVPITFITDKSNGDDPSTVEKHWLNRNEDSLLITVLNAAWIKVNFRQIGYYRVNYETSAWKAFTDALLLDIKVLNAPDRASLLDDAFSLADAGLLDFPTALDMSRYLVKEVDYVPWSVASSKLTFLHSILTDSLAFPKLRAYVHKLVKDAATEVTWDIDVADTHLHKRLRVTVLDLACSLGDPDCLLEVGSRFTSWIANPAARPHPDLRTMIYYHGLSSASSEENWDKMWQLYLDEKDAPEKIKLMYGLAAAKEPWLLRRYLQYAKDEALVRSQDYFSVLTYISGNPIGTPIVWDFVRAEWQYLVDRFTLNERNLGRLIPSITSSFTTEFKLKEMEAFFELYPDAGAGQAARKQALETVANRIKWLERNEESVRTWLDIEIP